jgi:hypothetical protein
MRNRQNFYLSKHSGVWIASKRSTPIHFLSLFLSFFLSLSLILSHSKTPIHTATLFNIEALVWNVIIWRYFFCKKITEAKKLRQRINYHMCAQGKYYFIFIMKILAWIIDVTFFNVTNIVLYLDNPTTISFSDSFPISETIFQYVFHRIPIFLPEKNIKNQSILSCFACFLHFAISVLGTDENWLFRIEMDQDFFPFIHFIRKF